MRTIKYEETDQTTGSTETLIAVDESVQKKFGNMQRVYEEGFSASDGVRAGTAATNGRIRHPEKGEGPRPKRSENSIENENPGLADN